MSAAEIVNKVWNYAHVLHDNGVGYVDLDFPPHPGPLPQGEGTVEFPGKEGGMSGAIFRKGMHKKNDYLFR